MSKITSAGGGGPGSVWETVLDVDFTAQSSQVLTVNGDYVIGGYTFTKFNTLYEVAAMEVVSGTGLVIRPSQTSNHGGAVRLCPGLYIPMASLIPDYVADTQLRLWLYTVSSNPTANYDNVIVAFENPATNTNTVMYYGYINGVKATARITYNGVDLGDFAIAWPGGHNVQVIEQFNAGGGMEFTGIYAGGWPSFSTLVPFAVRTSGGPAATATAGGINMASDHHIMIGAIRAWSATAYVATLGAVRLDYRL